MGKHQLSKEHGNFQITPVAKLFQQLFYTALSKNMIFRFSFEFIFELLCSYDIVKDLVTKTYNASKKIFDFFQEAF